MSKFKAGDCELRETRGLSGRQDPDTRRKLPALEDGTWSPAVPLVLQYSCSTALPVKQDSYKVMDNRLFL